MKKLLVILLTVAMLLSLGAMGVHAEGETANFEIGDILWNRGERYPDSGIYANYRNWRGFTMDGTDGGHGNHQTRVLHTSWGDFIGAVSNGVDWAVPTNSLTNEREYSLVYYAPDATEGEVVLQFNQNRDTSQVAIVADNDENVWLASVVENRYRNQFDPHGNGAQIDIFKVEKDTLKVTKHGTIFSKIDNGGGIGYSSFFYEPVNNALVFWMRDSTSADDCYLWRKVLFLDTMQWDPNTYSVHVSGGNAGYPFFNVDGNGGVVVVTNRNASLHSSIAFYPECDNDDGITKEEMDQYFPEGHRPDYLNYAFDQITAFVVPDICANDYEEFIVADADYSRISGTDEQRLTAAYRMQNYYPELSNNNGGDTWLDADGNLHVTYTECFRKLAWDCETQDYRWWHVVYNVETQEQLSKSLVFEFPERNGLLYWDNYDVFNMDGWCRLYPDPVTGELFLFSSEMDTKDLVVYKCIGTPEDGYTYEEVARHYFPENVNRFEQVVVPHHIHVNAHRDNGLVGDGTLAITFQCGRSDYNLVRIGIEYRKPVLTVEANDDAMGTVEGGGEYGAGEEATLTATPNDGYVFMGWYDAEGTLLSKETSMTVTVDHDDSYTAQFAAEGYGITYVMNGGKNNPNNPTEFTVETGAIKLLDPTHPNDFSFGGWYTDEAMTKQITEIPAGFMGELTLYAQWYFQPGPAVGPGPLTPGPTTPADIPYIDNTAPKPTTDPNASQGEEPTDVKPPVDNPEEPVELPFNDVPEEFLEDVADVFDRGLMIGTGVGEDGVEKFTPDKVLNRAMLVTILWRIEGEPVVDAEITFKDVEEGQWYTEAIRWAASEGVVKGYNADKFGVLDDITNEQFMTILYRYIARTNDVTVEDGVVGFADSDEISDWAVDAVEWAVANGIIDAGSDVELNPQDGVTRVVAARYLHRFFENFEIAE